MSMQFTPRRLRVHRKFHNAIRQYRLKAGLSQRQLAAALGLGRSVISRWERGLRLPAIPVLFRMAKELGTLAESLYYEYYAPRPIDREATDREKA